MPLKTIPKKASFSPKSIHKISRLFAKIDHIGPTKSTPYLIMSRNTMNLSTTSSSKLRTLKAFHQKINHVHLYTVASTFEHQILSLDTESWDRKKKKSSTQPSDSRQLQTIHSLQSIRTLPVSTAPNKTLSQHTLHITPEHGLLKTTTFTKPTQHSLISIFLHARSLRTLPPSRHSKVPVFTQIPHEKRQHFTHNILSPTNSI